MIHKIKNDGTFADAVGDAADGAVAHIADGENARDIGFKKSRIAKEMPASRFLSVLEKIGAGKKKALGIAAERAFEPFGTRLCADEDEERAGLALLVRF